MKICPICGQVFLPQVDRFVWCSRKCADEYLRIENEKYFLQHHHSMYHVRLSSPGSFGDSHLPQRKVGILGQ